jgi:hypothetical protein
MDGGEDEENGLDEELDTDDAPMALREDAPAARFDPTPYLRQLRGRGGGGEYLDVKWRLLWLRTEHPAAEIVTEHVQIEPTLAIFKATVTLPTGGKATGYGSETAGDFGDFIEKAETKAIGRALNALGYGAQFREPGEEDVPGATASFPQRPTPAARGGGYDAERPRAGGPTALPTTRRAEPVPEPPIDLSASRERSAAASRRERPSEPGAAASRLRPVEEPRAGEPAAAGEDLSDYSWTAFREWAESTGLPDRAAMEEFIGRPLRGLSPAEARDLVLTRRGEA